MNKKSPGSREGRPASRSVALNAVAAAVLFLSASMAQAMGLGRLSVQSALGESLRAEIDVSSLSAEEAANLQVRVASPDAYRSAGVDYNPVLPSTQTVLMRRPDGRPYLRLSSDRPVQEPFVDVILEISWSTGRLVREYTLLFDPPARQPSTGLAALPSTAPAFSAATPTPPVAAASTPAQLRAEAAAALAERRAEAAATAASAAAERRAAAAAAVAARASAAAATAAAAPAAAPAVETPAPTRQAAVRPAPRPTPEAAPAPPPVVVTTRPASPPAAVVTPDAAPRTAGAGSSTDTYQVQQGDTLSRIATRTQRPGVSLDQMLVSLYRSNGDAFIDNNMNRLKTGSVLAVPSTDAVKAIAPGEARQVIQAQSADFQSYRQRLAGVVPTARGAENARRASGQVQAAVDDRKQSASTTPDRLRLSKSASAAEERIAQENASRDSATRVAELSKNVEQLRRLSGETAASAAAANATNGASAGARGAAASAATAPAATTQAAAPASSPLPAVVVATPASAAATSTAAASNAALAAATAAAALAASSPPGSASQVAAAPATPVTPAAPIAGASSAAATPVPVTAAPEDERSVMDTLLDNPLFLPAVGVLALLLLAAIAFRLRARAKEDSGETSFLESRLQPDSFFGASGGQRIDTRESNGGASSSSMSYSLSQLDAIGDVDPVAEADVYLAYGRDLQAEEILKEAMRATPDRLAIRTKLLEVYAKRRDTKGFEVLATALFALTEGTGEDWAKAQEMGLQIDPANPMYQPGGRPEGLQATDSGHMIEPLGASTMPQSILPTATTVFQQTRNLDSQSGVDLDLDLGMAADSLFGTPSAAENTQPFNHDQYRETSSAPTSRFGADASAPPSRFGADTGTPASRGGADAGAPPSRFAADAGATPSRFGAEPASAPTSRFGAETAGNSMNFELPSDFPATYGGKTAAGAAAAGAAASGASTSAPASRPSPLAMDDTAPAAFSNPSSFGQMGNGMDSKPLEFDLSDISLDLDTPMDKDEPLGANRGRAEIPDASLDAMDLGMDMDLDGDLDGEGDPLERKFELAEEFRQIGDVEGARDLLREVVAKADGTLKVRAQGLLDSLA